MTSRSAELIPIECTPGVDTDRTPFSTPHYTWALNIRFVGDLPQKIGGWKVAPFDTTEEIQGTARSLYSASVAGRVYSVIGTNEKLYSILASRLTNITPLDTSTIAIAASLATHYATLGSNPISTVSGSNVIIVTDSEAALLKIGDTATLAGATTTNGILNTSLNAAHIVRSVSAGSWTFRVGTNASSTGSGGGASVIRKSGLITVSATAHGQENGDRAKINAAATTGGVTNTLINAEHIIRNVTTNTFDVMTTGTATSSVSGGGGASTTYQQEIPTGSLNQSFGQGYGMGLYGVGLYGVSKLSSQAGVYPRIWFTDRFGDVITTTPGNQTGVYSWGGNTAIAPTLISGAPTAINYQFVSDSILVTFGAAGVQNKIFASDQGDFTQWVASSTNQVFEDQIEGAGRLLSHVSAQGKNLIFTETQTYIFDYVGLPDIWSIQLKDNSIGIIAPMARVSVNDIAYWMDDANFYWWAGGDIGVIPSNTRKQSTIHNWMFDDLNYAQKSKTFCWFNPEFNEIWYHSLSSNSNEPDKVARFNIIDQTWVPDYISRTAAEYPSISLSNPRLIDTGTVYKHELGNNDNDAALPFTLVSNLRSLGRNTTNIDGIIPDSEQVGSATLNIQTQRFPQSTETNQNQSYAVTQTTERIPYTTNGGYWFYTWTGSEIDQYFRMGKWQEYVQKGAAN